MTIKVTVVFNVEDVRKLDFLEDFDVPYYAEKEDLPKEYKKLKRKLSNIQDIIEE